jgi:hypothetical protein
LRNSIDPEGADPRAACLASYEVAGVVKVAVFESSRLSQR